MNTGTACDLLCQYCGRPVIGQAVYGAQGAYHPECVQGPNLSSSYVPEPPPVMMRLAQLEQEVAELRKAYETQKAQVQEQ